MTKIEEYHSLSDTAPYSTASYIYDGLGRRVAKRVNGVVTKYVYDQEDILLQTDVSDSIIARYTHGPGIDEPIIMDRGGSSYYYIADALGSIAKVIDAVGNVINRYVYNSFGNIVEKTEGVANPYTYTGREYDAESGLYYYRARYYDARIGRFLSEDPVGHRFEISNLYLYVDSVRKLPLETSLYAYTGNSPINFIDPTGEAAMAVGICVAAMATDIGVTIYAINKYADEMKEIKGKIREIESQCDTLEDEIEHSEKLEELRRQAIKVTEKMIRARGRGYAIGIPIAIFCGVSPFLPF